MRFSGERRRWGARRRRTTPDPTVSTAAISDAVAFEAIAAQLAHDCGRLTEDELTAALRAIVADVETQADAFVLLTRIVRMASGSLESAARVSDVDPQELLRVAALEFARRH